MHFQSLDSMLSSHQTVLHLPVLFSPHLLSLQRRRFYMLAMLKESRLRGRQQQWQQLQRRRLRSTVRVEMTLGVTVVSTGCAQTLRRTWRGLTPAGCRSVTLSWHSLSDFPKQVVSSQNATSVLILLQDEREVKRQRRKQSNRESARRSRLRKQAECEALAVRVNELMNENVKLRAANEQLLKLQHMMPHQVCLIAHVHGSSACCKC